jgi:phospholipid/cholesterol/gamma-HCH transport system ATP-binding protein
MSELDPVVEVEGLSVRFGENQVLSNVDAQFVKGEISVILGASGSGKTTVLKHVLGLLEPEIGTVRLFGRNLSEMSASELAKTRTRLGMLFQQGALLNSVNVARNARVPLEQHTDLPSPLIDRIVMTKLKLVGLEDSWDTMPDELSGGMRKRASLARALALDPELLLCDEPSSGLDPLSSEALDELLLELKQALDMTMVIISHDLESVRRVADRVFFLHSGQILFEGTMDEAEASDKPELVRYFAASTPD